MLIRKNLRINHSGEDNIQRVSILFCDKIARVPKSDQIHRFSREYTTITKCDKYLLHDSFVVCLHTIFGKFSTIHLKKEIPEVSL